MAEVIARYRGGRIHREAFGELHARVAFCIEQAEQRRLLTVFRASRIARGRADAAVLLVDERIVVERFVAGVTPEFTAHALVQAFGEGLRQAIRERLEQDRVVIVVVRFEARDMLFDADARGDGETPDPVLPARILWG